jgi:curved DNA-binding protein CbpA
MASDDYYGLLGVDAAAPTADIRAAYREKKAALDTKGDKAEIARLNKAWNVLSDPYQRGRYDAQREAGEESESAEVPAVVGAGGGSGAGGTAPPRRRRFFEPAAPRERPAAQPPTIDIPAGYRLAAQKPRMMALAIDLFVMLLVVFGLQLALTDRVTESWYPDEHARLTALAEDELPGEELSVDEAREAADDADEAADRAEEGNESNAAQLRDEADAADDEYEDLVDEQADLSRDVFPAYLFVLEITMLLCLLYLVVPSALGGQTLGKKLRGVRVVRLDGSPLGWTGALIRYGVLIVAANLLLIVSGSLGVLGLLLLGGLFFLVLGWMRNPNKQGMQDRIAKTIVVDA